MMIRNLAKRHLSSPNTIRYRLEWPRLSGIVAGLEPVDTLLDAGAGSGEFSKRFYQKGFARSIVAFEPMPANFRRLQDNHAPLMEDAVAHNSGIVEIDQPDNSVDAITCNQVLEHIEDHEAVVSEFSRVLKTGGHAIVSVPQPPAPWPEGDHVREGYDSQSLSALMFAQGFEPIAFDWFLTKPVQERWLKVKSLPLKGRFVPLAVFNHELSLSREERRAAQPYGIVGLFKLTV